jgi:hypothetical protein
LAAGSNASTQALGLSQVGKIQGILGSVLASELALGDKLASLATQARFLPINRLIWVEHLVSGSYRRFAVHIAFDQPDVGGERRDA